MRKILKLINLCLMLLVGLNLCKAQSQQVYAPHVPGELIIKFKAVNSAKKTSQLSAKMQAQVTKKIPDLEVELWKIDEQNAGINALELVEQYKDHPDIEFIEPNYLYTTTEIDLPNDAEFNRQWALHNTGTKKGSVKDADIDAPEAWKIQSDTSSIVVGIIDTGVDWRHPDLINNIWQNSGEDLDGDGLLVKENGKWVFDSKDENGIDDDKNGYIDDFIGWNFVEDNNQPFDYHAIAVDKFVQSHGTHIAGIIGASCNNEVGICGVNQKVKMASLKFLTDERSPKGSGWDATRAIRYAYKMGMQISNNSWGSSVNAGTIGKAIEEAQANGHLFVAAAGNGDRHFKSINNDNHAFYPANYSFDNIIVAANSNYSDNLSNSSNYGLYNVDIAAPGTNIYSCLPNSSVFYEPYGLKSGTSMAAPFVTGTLALLWEKNMELHQAQNPQYLKQILLENADTIPQLQLKVANSGRLNAHKALAASIDTAYTNQNMNCRQKDSLTLVNIYNALNLETLNFWDYENESMEAWNGTKLNDFGCVTKLDISLNNDKVYPIPSEIGDLKHLNALKVSQYDPNNKVPTNEYLPLPMELFSLNKLSILSLVAYKLNGPIPKELGNLKNLEHLTLASNNLSGTIPTELTQLYKLKRLNISNNKLSGSIPKVIEHLTYLRTLNLSNNQFSHIPGSIGNLNLEYLNLSHNNFEGNIPSEIGRLGNLYELYLNDNSFSGSIPGSFSNLTKLGEVEFYVTNNNLSGCYDPELIKIGGYSTGVDFRVNGFSNHNINVGNQFEVLWEEFVATEANSCWASEATLVWPGDLNNDGIVNGDDIAFYGLAKGNTGPSREKSDTTPVSWEGKLCPDWSSKVYGINAKHSDANGDGLVDTFDYVTVLNNMDSLNPDHYNGSGSLNYYSNGIQLVLKEVEIDSKLMTYDLFLNNLYGDQSAIYGLSGAIKFNSDLKDATIEWTDECIDTLYSYRNFDKIKDRLVFALTQVDDINITCEDALARIVVAIDEAIDQGGDQFVSFKVNGIHTQNNTYGGAVNESIGANAYSSFSTNSDKDFEVHAFTTPQLCFRGGTAKAEVSGGVVPYTYQWSTGEIDSIIYNLAAGDYSLEVKDAIDSIKVIEFEVANFAEPAYDENGELIECEIIIETECSDEIDYSENAPEDKDFHIMHHGIYTAANSIITDAQIFKHEKVELKAGKIITLKPGFSMGYNTKLDVTNENCSDE